MKSQSASHTTKRPEQARSVKSVLIDLHKCVSAIEHAVASLNAQELMELKALALRLNQSACKASAKTTGALSLMTEALETLNEAFENNLDVATHDSDPALQREFKRLDFLLAGRKKLQAAKAAKSQKENPAERRKAVEPRQPAAPAKEEASGKDTPQAPPGSHQPEKSSPKNIDNQSSPQTEAKAAARLPQVTYLAVGGLLATAAMAFMLWFMSIITPAPTLSDIMADPLKPFFSEGAFLAPRGKLGDNMFIQTDGVKVTKCDIFSQ